MIRGRKLVAAQLSSAAVVGRPITAGHRASLRHIRFRSINLERAGGRAAVRQGGGIRTYIRVTSCFDLRKQSYRCAYDMLSLRRYAYVFRPSSTPCDICSSDFVTFIHRAVRGGQGFIRYDIILSSFFFSLKIIEYVLYSSK